VVHQDILTCGVCQKPFALADIVKFIQHKVLACNKENYSLGFSGDHRDANNTDSDDGEGGSGGAGNGSSSLPVPLSVVNTRRPSISAPINSKKASASASASSSASISTPGRILCTPPPTSPRMLGPSDILMDEPPSSTPKRRAGSSSPPSKADDLNHNLQDEDLKPRIKQEHLDTGSSPDEAVVKRVRTDVVDAESNTTHSGKLCAMSLLFHKGKLLYDITRCAYFIHSSIHLWRYSPFRALTSLTRRLHSSLFAALLLQPLIPSSCSA
jgi:hypothetical protein